MHNNGKINRLDSTYINQYKNDKIHKAKLSQDNRM